MFLRKYFDIAILTIFALIWSYYTYVKGLPINIPDNGSFLAVWLHYVHPLAVAVIVQILYVLVFRKKNIDSWIPYLYIPYILAVVFIHFNFKAWTPLVNPVSYDAYYLQIDNYLWPIKQGFTIIADYISLKGRIDLSSFYNQMFVLMFFLSFTFHLIYDELNNFRKVVIGVCLILLVGGVSYWVCPAVGPFIFSTNDTTFTPIQHGMYSYYLVVCQQHIIPSGYFTAAPAAMPSLHIAHSFFLMIMALRTIRPLGYFYTAVFLGILFISVASQWHYIIDIPFGLIISIGSIWIVDKVYSFDQVQNQKELKLCKLAFKRTNSVLY